MTERNFLLIVSCFAGFVAHHGIFIRGEWHLHTFHIVVGHALVTFLAYVWLRSSVAAVPDALNLSMAMFSCYVAALWSSIIIYRLFFHRLRRFPGPKLAAISKFWHVFKNISRTNHLVLQDLHQRYGDCVRTGGSPCRDTLPTEWCMEHQHNGSG